MQAPKVSVQSRIFVDSKLTWSCGKLFEESVSVQAVMDTVLRKAGAETGVYEREWRERYGNRARGAQRSQRG